MALTTKDIANFINEAKCMKVTVAFALHVLLLKSLSPSQKKAYDLILQEDTVTSHTCNAHFGWKTNRAGNVLKSLYDLDLVERLGKKVIGSQFKPFINALPVIQRRDKYDGNMFCGVLFVQSFAHLETSHSRHHDIQEDQINLFSFCNL